MVYHDVRKAICYMLFLFHTKEADFPFVLPAIYKSEVLAWVDNMTWPAWPQLIRLMFFVCLSICQTASSRQVRLGSLGY